MKQMKRILINNFLCSLLIEVEEKKEKKEEVMNGEKKRGREGGGIFLKMLDFYLETPVYLAYLLIDTV